MNTKYQTHTSKLILAVGFAPLLPAAIHSSHYLNSPFFRWAVLTSLAFSYFICIFLALPGYLILMRHGRFNLKRAALFTGLIGIFLGLTLFALNSWGTGGYTYYGELGYQTVELGKLTLAGYILAGLRVFYYFTIGLIGGIAFYQIAKNRTPDNNG